MIVLTMCIRHEYVQSFQHETVSRSQSLTRSHSHARSCLSTRDIVFGLENTTTLWIMLERIGLKDALRAM